MGKGVLHFDEEPMLFASSSPVHTDECELALESLAVQRKFQPACFDAPRHRLRDRLVCQHVVTGTLIPDGHRPGPLLPFRDGARERRIGQRVVLDLDRQAPFRRVRRGALGHRPALEHAVRLQAEIVMESAGVVLLHDKDWDDPFTPLQAGLPPQGPARSRLGGGPADVMRPADGLLEQGFAVVQRQAPHVRAIHVRHIEEVEIRRMLFHPSRHLTGVGEVEALLQRPEAGPTLAVQAGDFANNDAGWRQAVP